MKQRVKECELSRLVRDVVDEVASFGERDAVAVTVEPRARAVISGSKRELSRALANVVQNAIENSPHGHAVHVRVVADGGVAVVDVHDDGPGVPATMRERVFEPFYSTRPGAAGLGLAVTHSVVAAHGGRVRFLDAPGCTVRIELPRISPAAAWGAQMC